MTNKFTILLYFFFFVFYETHANSRVSIDSTSYYMELSKFHKNKNEFKLALQNIQLAIEHAETSTDYEAIAESYSFLGSIYYDLKKYDDAIQTFKKSIIIYQDLAPTISMAFTYYYLGVSYMEKEDYQNANYNFDKAEALYNTLQVTSTQSLLNLQKAKIHISKNNTAAADALLNSISIIPEEQDVYKVKAEALYLLGSISLQAKRSNLAFNYFNRALEIINQIENLELRAKIYKSLSETFENLRDKEQAYLYLKKYTTLTDALALENQQKLNTDDFISFKEAERLKTIEQMDKEYKEQQKATKFSKLISILSIALISILSLLSLTLYKNNILRSQTNKILKDKNKELQIAKEKAEKASKARAEFLSTVSHELRTPLNAINGITHILLNEKPKKSQLQYLTSLKFSGDYLLSFINDILEINRVESENIEVEYLNLNIKQLLDDIQNSFKEMATKNNNNFVLEIDDAIPEHLISDPTKLSQIFINLINNALKFTSNGDVFIKVKLNDIQKNIASIHFEISDTGIGIPKEKHENIFESFSQGSVEINRKYGGTGLGLAIVKRLILILGGEIKLESDLNKGTKFYFDLDFRIGTQTYAEVKNNYSESIFKNKHILLVEDNKINQMITEKMLKNKNILCTTIDNGEAAIDIIKSKKFDLVLMDVHLPGINGTTATSQIRDFNKTIPIIALTAISLNENREMLLSYGMNDVVTKPFNPDNFYKVLAEQLTYSEA